MLYITFFVIIIESGSFGMSYILCKLNIVVSIFF